MLVDVFRTILFFLIDALKHKLWVLVITDLDFEVPIGRAGDCCRIYFSESPFNSL